MSGADEGYLHEIAAIYQVADPPTVEVVAHVHPEEQLPLIVECMHELGWPDVKMENQGLSYPSGDDVREAVSRALYTCFARYPISPEYMNPSEEMFERLYLYYKGELAPCLRSKGHPISEAPSWESWIAAVKSGGAYWDPASEVDPANYPPNCPPLPAGL